MPQIMPFGWLAQLLCETLFQKSSNYRHSFISLDTDTVLYCPEKLPIFPATIFNLSLDFPICAFPSFSNVTFILLEAWDFQKCPILSPHFTPQETEVQYLPKVTLQIVTLQDICCSSLWNGFMSSLLRRRILPRYLLWPMKYEQKWRVPLSRRHVKNHHVVLSRSVPQQHPDQGLFLQLGFPIKDEARQSHSQLETMPSRNKALLLSADR